MKAQSANEKSGVRLDKWLWAARFHKTRSIAKAMIEGGKVHNDEKETIVTALSDQRRGAPEAQLLYQETEKSVKQREAIALARKANALSMPHPDRRPNKKERRELVKFKDHIL